MNFNLYFSFIGKLQSEKFENNHHGCTRNYSLILLIQDIIIILCTYES